MMTGRTPIDWWRFNDKFVSFGVGRQDSFPRDSRLVWRSQPTMWDSKCICHPGSSEISQPVRFPEFGMANGSSSPNFQFPMEFSFRDFYPAVGYTSKTENTSDERRTQKALKETSERLFLNSDFLGVSINVGSPTAGWFLLGKINQHGWWLDVPLF